MARPAPIPNAPSLGGAGGPAESHRFPGQTGRQGWTAACGVKESLFPRSREGQWPSRAASRLDRLSRDPSGPALGTGKLRGRRKVVGRDHYDRRNPGLGAEA